MQIPTLSVLPVYRRKSWLLFFPALCLMLSFFSMASWLRFSAKNAESTAQASGQEAPRIRVLHFTLTPLGFNPSAATIPEGQYAIEVTNRSDLPEFSLNLGQLSVHKLKETNRIKKHGEWSGLFDLKRGDFVLTINEKPEWTASIQAVKENNK